MPVRINKAIELLEQDQPVYYVGSHTGELVSSAHCAARVGKFTSTSHVLSTSVETAKSSSASARVLSSRKAAYRSASGSRHLGWSRHTVRESAVTSWQGR